MITSLLSLLISGLLLYVVFYVVGLLVQGAILKIIGVILAIIFLLYALRIFNVPIP